MISSIFLTSSVTEDTSQDSFEQEPPLPQKMKIQKLATPLADGSNLILSVQYYEEKTLPKSINLFANEIQTAIIKDDGVFPDKMANDYIYTTYIKENSTNFIKNITDREEIAKNQGGVYVYNGHNGSFINFNDIPLFDLSGFEAYETVEIYMPLLNVSDCNQTILKQNSLFITDLSVVEDPARTFQMAYDPDGSAGPMPMKPETGNPVGAWTFGTLIKNIANETRTGISPKKFLKEWLKTYTETQMIGSAK